MDINAVVLAIVVGCAGLSIYAPYALKKLRKSFHDYGEEFEKNARGY